MVWGAFLYSELGSRKSNRRTSYVLNLISNHENPTNHSGRYVALCLNGVAPLELGVLFRFFATNIPLLRSFSLVMTIWIFIGSWSLGTRLKHKRGACARGVFGAELQGGVPQRSYGTRLKNLIIIKHQLC